MSLVEKALRKLQDSALSPSGANAADRARAEGTTSTSASDHAIRIDSAKLQAIGLLPPDNEARQLAQQYRRIKRPLIANAFGLGVPRVKQGHLVLIASAMPGEGKTFTALNLALSMSIERDIRVLLVDADVAKPHISGVLGLDDARGLLDVLRDKELDVEHMILQTSVPNFTILPAGTLSAEATELLASARMGEVVQELGERDPKRIVLFDSPPLLHTSESHVLTQVAGQIVVVVRAEFTPQPILLDALKMLDGHTAVSLVLNQSTRAANSAYYYYGYAAQK